MPKSRVIVLAGPTAVGKTAISLKLARELGCEIISADSMQIYKGMDIGTAKITKEEMGDIRHHLIDVVNPGENFDVFQYQEMAKNKIQEIISRGNIPLITGGTGFYIQALLYDINFTEESSDKSYRRELQELVDTGRGQELYEKLLCVDKEYAGTVHPNNYKRIIRALDYYNNTGEKFSSHNEEQSKNQSPYNFNYFVLNMNREKLYKNIDRRVDIMFDMGLLEEVKNLVKQGYDRNLTSMQAIGYKEFFDYFDGAIDLEQLKNQIKIDTRHYAKRQLTWFRREKETIFIDKDEFENDDKVAEYIIKKYYKEGI